MDSEAFSDSAALICHSLQTIKDMFRSLLLWRKLSFDPFYFLIQKYTLLKTFKAELTTMEGTFAFFGVE